MRATSFMRWRMRRSSSRVVQGLEYLVLVIAIYDYLSDFHCHLEPCLMETRHRRSDIALDRGRHAADIHICQDFKDSWQNCSRELC